MQIRHRQVKYLPQQQHDEAEKEDAYDDSDDDNNDNKPKC